MWKLAAAALAMVALQTGPLAQAPAAPSVGQGPLYDTAVLRTISIRFDVPNWHDRLDALYQTGEELPATVTVDGQVYRDVGVHYRGASSYRMVRGDAKKSLNLSFDHVHEDQRLLGHRTLNLLNGNGDPSFVRTRLYSEISRHYIPTPRTNYVRVVINDESFGVYINSEQFNSDFTREWFPSTKDDARWKVPGSPRGRGGMEYLGDDPDSYRYLYEIKTKDDPQSWQALISMFRILNQTPLDQLESALAPVLDIDGVLKFLAIEVALVNSDGYWTRASDYNIYLDGDGRFHVIPHDVNEALAGGRGGFRFGGGGVNLDPLVAVDDPSKPLRSRLLQVPALRQRYLAYVKDIAEVWLDWQKVEPLVQQYRAQIAEDMKVDRRSIYGFRSFEEGVADVKSFFDGRRAFLLQRP